MIASHTKSLRGMVREIGRSRTSACTWACSVSSSIMCLVVFLLGLSFQFGIDGPLPHLLETVMMLAVVVAMYLAPSAWLVFVLIRKFRLSPESHLLQIGIFVLGWILTLPLFAWLESQHVPGWFLD